MIRSRHAMSVLLLFMIVFQFKIPFFYNSLILSLLYLIPVIIIRGKIIVEKELSKVIIFFFLFYVILSVMIVIVGFFSFENDYLRLKTIASNLLSIFAMSLYIIYYSKFLNKSDLIKNIFLVFFIQSLIIIASIFIPSISDMLAIFKSMNDVDISEKYNGVRGNALAGSQFFPMACCFALIQWFAGYRLLIGERKNLLINSIVVLLIFFAGQSVGRTSGVGFLFIFAFLLSILLFNKKDFIKTVTKLLLILSFFFLFVYGLIHDSQYIKILNQYSEFAFEFVYKYLDGNGFSTDSTSILSKMYFNIPINEFIIGYGRFYEDNGVMPYLRTDAGYMRDIINFGVMGVFFLFSYFVIFLKFLCKYNSDTKNVLIKKYTSFMLIMLIAILHIKGSVILNLTSFNVLLFYIVYTMNKKSDYYER